MKKLFSQSFRFLLISSLMLGGVYTSALWLVGQALFHQKASGSLIKKNGTVRGSELLAQKFESSRYFWSRPSAADFATVASGASNLGPTSATLKERVEKRRADLLKAHHLSAEASIPPELLLASGSGLDPHLSPEGVRFQLNRVAQGRHLTTSQLGQLQKLIENSIEPRVAGFIGEERINILRLNLELDIHYPQTE